MTNKLNLVDLLCRATEQWSHNNYREPFAGFVKCDYVRASHAAYRVSSELAQKKKLFAHFKSEGCPVGQSSGLKSEVQRLA